MSYTRGLHEVGDGLWAYLQPDGGWGWSNAGLIADDATRQDHVAHVRTQVLRGVPAALRRKVKHRELDAAVRELKEECGFGARKLTYLRSITLAPGYMNHEIHLVLAEELYPERLPGDEPEELEVLPWKLSDLHELMLREDCSEGRSLAAMFIVRELMERRA